MLSNSPLKMDKYALKLNFYNNKKYMKVEEVQWDNIANYILIKDNRNSKNMIKFMMIILYLSRSESKIQEQESVRKILENFSIILASCLKHKGSISKEQD